MSLGAMVLLGSGVALMVAGLVGRIRWIPRMEGVEALVAPLGARISAMVLGLVCIGFTVVLIMR